MPPPKIFDPDALDFGAVVADRAAIMNALPHREEFQLLHAIVLWDSDEKICAGYIDLSPTDWWVKGHIPGRPLFPGVLMIEVAAQLCSYAQRLESGSSTFAGFAAADEVRFRGIVEPPARFVVISKILKTRQRRFDSAAQGFVDGRLVFEAKIAGMAV